MALSTDNRGRGVRAERKTDPSRLSSGLLTAEEETSPVLSDRERRDSGRGRGRCKGPEVAGSSASSRSCREAGVAGANGGDEDRGTGEG